MSDFAYLFFLTILLELSKLRLQSVHNFKVIQEVVDSRSELRLVCFWSLDYTPLSICLNLNTESKHFISSKWCKLGVYIIQFVINIV